ncbi:TraR/DksA C4-type zinc finger protein [Candidatus Gottesmanbacteria bacterium]|nr:TraR/DksA C4-type zinc finger protein [Candidatus Gottesmanbacteria bacterium]
MFWPKEICPNNGQFCSSLLFPLLLLIFRLCYGYGICERCGKMIDTDRLAVMPAAELCLECEKKKEK